MAYINWGSNGYVSCNNIPVLEGIDFVVDVSGLCGPHNNQLIIVKAQAHIETRNGN
jgi:hypothetical protein